MEILYHILSFFYFLIYVLSGQITARRFIKSENVLIVTWLGCVFALLMLIWLPALFSFVLGFTLLAQLLALIPCIAFAAICFGGARRNTPQAMDTRPARNLALALSPLFLLGVFLFLTHVIPQINGSLHVGQSTFGDLPLHLGFVTSMGEQGFFPPEYSILPGAQVGYPFLCDSVSATFYVLGASLRFSMLLPAIFAFALVLVGVYCFFEAWLKKSGVALFATLLFFVGGGLGFVYFFDLAKSTPGNFTNMFEAFYQTPTNNIYYGVKWVNPLVDMLIPQRATLFGWAFLFPCLFMLRRAAYDTQYGWFIPLGIIAGLMPLIHTHSFLALGILSAVYLIQSVMKKGVAHTVRHWYPYALLAFALALPQLFAFTFKQSQSFLQPHFNWANETDSFFWFYIKNLGLLFILLPFAFYRLNKGDRAFYFGALVIWVLAEFIQFQPNPYDNNKLLFCWFAYTCGIVALFLADLWQMLKGFKGRMGLAALVVCLLFLSGVLTLAREVISDHELFGANEVDAAAFIKENTAPDSIFLTASNHNNAVASLTGRNVLCGTGSYLYYHGLDYSSREALLPLLYEQPASYLPLLATEYGIDYIWVSNAERYQYDVDFSYFDTLPILFQNRSVSIYKFNPAP
ncbi:MAG: hypothetical protein LBS18_05860 [Clostridiales bacterium]|jgi:hypothetical protein|nr:hypothetical protein [Clostridiales bacterium]